MATFLDIGLLSSFSIIFYFIFVFVLVYAVLIIVFKDKLTKNITAMIALSFALIVMLSAPTREMIGYVTPSFFTVILFVFFAVLIYMFMGGTEADVKSLLGTQDTTRNFIVGIVGVIALGALGKTFFSSGSPVGGTANATTNASAVGGAGEAALMATLTHPKVLGLVLILIVGAYAMYYLSMSPIITIRK